MITLVSAVYKNGPTNIYGGRGRDVWVYRSSLINLSKLGLPIVIYTDSQDVAEVEDVIKPYFAQYKVIPFDLSSYEHHDQYLIQKEEWGMVPGKHFNDRNGILCHMKPYWVQQVATVNWFNTDKFLWIDSGLSHHGIFPEKVGGVELAVRYTDATYWPQNQANIFNPSLAQKLERWTDSGLLFIAQPYQGDTTELCSAGGCSDISKHLIGGIFGGKSSAFTEFFYDYRQMLKRLVFVHKLNLLEEQVFSTMYATNPRYFQLREFGTWWFHSPGERCSYLTEDRSDSFYKLFL